MKLWKIYLNSNNDSKKKKSFAAVHCNIRSLQSNLENFVHVLSDLQFSVSVIGLSEINCKVNKGITNVNISGYDSISQLSLSNTGAVSFYINKDLTFTVLLVTNVDSEALRIEIIVTVNPIFR